MADTVEGLMKRLREGWLEYVGNGAGVWHNPTPSELLAASALEALVVERDALAHDLRLVQERKDDIEAQRDKLLAGLEYAAMGLGRIHDSLLSNGPKQASGEMTAHFRDHASSTLNEIAP